MSWPAHSPISSHVIHSPGEGLWRWGWLNYGVNYTIRMQKHSNAYICVEVQVQVHVQVVAIDSPGAS
jgi:hypothetical protein